MANEELIARGKRESSKLFMISPVCAVMTIPGILLWQNGLAWHMNAWLVLWAVGNRWSDGHLLHLRASNGISHSSGNQGYRAPHGACRVAQETRSTGSLPGTPQSTPLLTYIARVKVTLPQGAALVNKSQR